MRLRELVYCVSCGQDQPVGKDEPSPDQTGKLYADLWCRECHLVIFTFRYEEREEA